MIFFKKGLFLDICYRIKATCLYFRLKKWKACKWNAVMNFYGHKAIFEKHSKRLLFERTMRWALWQNESLVPHMFGPQLFPKPILRGPWITGQIWKWVQESTPSNSRNNKKAGETKQRAPISLLSKPWKTSGKKKIKFFILNLKKCKEHHFWHIIKIKWLNHF